MAVLLSAVIFFAWVNNSLADSLRGHSSSTVHIKLHSHSPTVSYGHPAWLSNCTSIYLDIGSNLGVQIRKLFEAEKYPDAPVLSIFDSTFGASEQRRLFTSDGHLCALGMEANPRLFPRLQQIQEAYLSRGWHVHFYPFAAWKEESVLDFNITEDVYHADWGARVVTLKQERERERETLKQEGHWHIEHVRAVDFADFVETLPSGSVKLMKMDIEGAEYETMARMMEERALCQNRIAEAFIEAHTFGKNKTWAANRGYKTVHKKVADQPWCLPLGGPTKLNCLDDETYRKDVGADFGEAPFEPNASAIAELRKIMPVPPLPPAQMTPAQRATYAKREADKRAIKDAKCPEA